MPGLQGGGVNFDAKSEEIPPIQKICFAHIGGMDLFARALITADKILEESSYLHFRRERYKSFDTGKGAEFEKGIYL